jgi:hypothetical protein
LTEVPCGVSAWSRPARDRIALDRMIELIQVLIL